MSDSRSGWPIVLVGAVIAAGAIGYFWRDMQPPPEAEPAAMPETEAQVPEPREDVPRHPITPPERPDGASLVPLPPLDDSDSYFALDLVGAFGNDLDTLLDSEALIEKFVTTVDNLPRKSMAERIRPVGRMSENFDPGDAGSEGPFVLGPANYARYDGVVNMLVTADVDTLVDSYRRFYPLLQEAYESLGYPDQYFNDRMIDVIDHLLATELPAEPVRLIRPNVLFEFADPEIEAMSVGQKLLIRIGNDHASAVKARLTEFRSRIATTSN